MCGSYKERHPRSRGVTRRGIGAIIKSGSKRPKIVFKELSKNFKSGLWPSQFKHLYGFDSFTLDASERLLLRAGRPVPLTPKEFETLLTLVRGAGRVMPKEELLKEIWSDAFVGEATLAQNVFTLRKALGEPEGGGAFVETIPRRGYRFAVEVRERREGAEGTAKGLEGAHALAVAQADDESRAVVKSQPPPRTRPRPHLSSPFEASVALTDVPAHEPRNGHVPTASSSSSAAREPRPDDAPGGRPVLAAGPIAAAVFGSVAALVYLIYRTSVRPDVERARAPGPAVFPTMKLTRLPVTGAVNEAVISPDGNYLAYAASETGRQGQGIWVRQVAAASNTQQIVAPDEGTSYGALIFSPDSQHLYYGEAREGAGAAVALPRARARRPGREDSDRSPRRPRHLLA